MFRMMRPRWKLSCAEDSFAPYLKKTKGAKLLLQPIDIRRIVMQHHARQFQRPLARYLSIIHHSGQRQSQSLPCGCI